MQEALQLAEQHERDCMERVEREQREAGVNPCTDHTEQVLVACIVRIS